MRFDTKIFLLGHRLVNDLASSIPKYWNSVWRHWQIPTVRVYSGIFPNGIQHEDDILAALSLIFYAITLIPVIKYVFIVLRANDNGEGN